MKFLANVMKEMKATTWPKSEELSKYTGMVVVTVLVATVFFAVVDFGLTNLLQLVLSNR